MAAIELSHIHKRYGETVVVDDLSLHVASGEFVVLVGPSGCGKSTLLRIVAGLLEPSAGTVRIDGRDVTQLAPGERDLAMVFQSYALYPHMTVRENIAFPLKVRKLAPDAIARKVGETAEMLGLASLLDRFPRNLSGGQRQRVAMGRAIVREPKAFLFDEPLSNLDAGLRAKMRADIAALHRRLGATTIYVTHDQHEAMTLADRLVLLSHGRIAQIGPPLEVYGRPNSRLVAEFLGSPPMNFLPVVREGDELVGAGFRVRAEGLQSGAPRELWLGVRPEAMRLGERAGGTVATGLAAVPAVAEWVERTGSDGFLYAKIGDASVVVRLPGDALGTIRVGGAVHLALGEVRYFARESGAAL